MSHTPHELAADFPKYAKRLQWLKTTDVHFRNLAEIYHTLNRDVHRAETHIEPISDHHLVILRKQRAALKDEIFELLTAGTAAESSGT